MKRRGFLAGAAFLAAPAIVQAQAVGNWPGTRPVRIIHPSQAGGPGDIYTRLLCEHFSRVFGGTFVTENRVGGTGTIGTAAVAQAALLMLLAGPSYVGAMVPSWIIRDVPSERASSSDWAQRRFALIDAHYHFQGLS